MVSSRQHGFLCRQALAEHEQGAHYILEETGRNTAPAIWFAAKASDPDDILLVMPSDHWIEDISGFAETVRRASTICAAGRWVTFGITATEPATGYGYIEVADRNDDVADVVSFTEKPERGVAEQYLASGRHFWNSGIFMVRAGACLESCERHQPALAAAAAACFVVWGASHPAPPHLPPAAVESALFCIAFEKGAPANKEEAAQQCLCGAGRNKWFDKSFTVVIFENGRGGLNSMVKMPSSAGQSSPRPPPHMEAFGSRLLYTLWRSHAATQHALKGSGAGARPTQSRSFHCL